MWGVWGWGADSGYIYQHPIWAPVKMKKIPSGLRRKERLRFTDATTSLAFGPLRHYILKKEKREKRGGGGNTYALT